MLFTSELGSMARQWRLQKDGSWRKFDEGDLSLKPTDFTAVTPNDVPKIKEKILEIGKVTYDIDPGHWPSEHEQLHHYGSVFRKEYPAEPSLDQLRNVIAAGSDRTHNVLILNVDGRFELRQCPPFNQLAFDPSIVVRHETYCAGNGYVGSEAAKDDSFLQDEFVASLDIWKEHLTNHETQEYSDMHSMASLAEIQLGLEEIQNSWKPDY